MNNQKEKPNLSDILYQQKSDILKTINCVNIGIIQSFDATDQTATIRMAIKKIIDVLEDGTKIVEERPLLLKCPVLVLSGGSSHLTFPVAQGDTCIILFNDRDIDNWFYEGGVKIPNTNRTHDLSDGFALVGIRNIQNAIDDYLSNGVRIKLNANTKIDLLDNAINSLAALFTHTGDLLVTGYISDNNATTPKMQDMRNTYNTHTHGGGSAPTQKM